MPEPELRADAPPAAAVDVCICTFRRASLRQALESLARQQNAPAFRIVIADNDHTPSARAPAEAAATELGLHLAYVHAPAANISIARNACIEAARAPYIAFLDDDETAAPDWLAALSAAIARQGADVVFGPVLAQLGPDAPAWAAAGDFHSVRPAIRANGEIDTGYAGNVIIRRAALAGARFDPAFGAGGEDTMFFAALHARGAKLGYCPEAIAYEPTPAARATMQWLWRRAFRSGQTHARMLAARGRGRVAIAAPAMAKAGYCALVAAVNVWSPVRSRAAIIRGALHAGAAFEAVTGSGAPAREARGDRVAQQ